MKHTLLILTAIFLLPIAACGESQRNNKPQPQPKLTQLSKVDTVLNQLDENVAKLKTYKVKIEYLFTQDPEIWDATTFKKGHLYFKDNADRSMLRINFETKKEDDEKQQKYREHYIFDGVWLTEIDYQLKQVEYRQLEEVNEPADVFKRLSSNFPLIGFTDSNELKNDFDISYIEPNSSDDEKFEHLKLKVSTDSKFKDDYTEIDFWIDKKTGLPTRFIAISTENDIYDVKLKSPSINKKLSDNIFKAKFDKDFTINKTPLKKDN